MNLLRLATAGLLLGPLFTHSAAAQALDATFASPSSLYAPGEVYALGPQQADGKRVVAGNFIRVNGSAISNLVRLDAAGNVDQAFAQAVGTASNVYHVRGLAAGQYMLGTYRGTITAGGLVRSALLRLNADGTADASFNPGTGPATGIATNPPEMRDFATQPDGKVVLTGIFTTFNNVPAPGVVRLNSDGSVDTGFNVGTGFGTTPGTYKTGSAVAVQADGKVLVGGQFETFNGQPTACLVRLTATGSIDASFTSPLISSVVDNIVVQPDGKILVTGALLTNGGPLSSTLIRLLPNGSPDPGFIPPTDFTFIATYMAGPMVLQPDGKIVAIGASSRPGGTPHVARLNANGSQDASFQVNPGTKVTPLTLGLQADGSVLLGGKSDTFIATEYNLMRLSSTGTADAAFAPRLQLPGMVAAVVRQPDGQYLIGGNFTEVNGQAVHHLARLTDSGTLDAGYSGATGLLPGAVSCLALQPDGNLLAGTTRGVRRFLSSGAPDATFTMASNPITNCLALQPDGKVLVGGNFQLSSGASQYRNLARFTASGALDPSFERSVSAAVAPGLPGITTAVLVQPDGRIVAASRFSVSSGASTCRVVRYETTGALDPTFNNSTAFSPVAGQSLAENQVYCLVQQPDGMLLAGGSFRAANGTPQQGVARLTPTGQLDTGFTPDATLTGTVFGLALQPNGRVLLGGSFTGTAATYRNLARVLANGQPDATFGNATQPDAAVRAMLVQADGRIVVAGAFTTIGSTGALAVTRLSAANVLQVAAPTAVASRTAAWPVPAREVLHVAPDASAHPLSVELLDALGRPVGHQPATGAAEVTFDTRALPAGMYLLRVHYAAGAVTRRLAVQ